MVPLCLVVSGRESLEELCPNGLPDPTWAGVAAGMACFWSSVLLGKLATHPADAMVGMPGFQQLI